MFTILCLPQNPKVHSRLDVILTFCTWCVLNFAGPLCSATVPTSHWSKPRLVLGQWGGSRWIHYPGVHQELDHLWWQRPKHSGIVYQYVLHANSTDLNVIYWLRLLATYLWCGKICRVGLYTELFDAIIPTLFLCFLLISYPYILLYF